MRKKKENWKKKKDKILNNNNQKKAILICNFELDKYFLIILKIIIEYKELINTKEKEIKNY